MWTRKGERDLGPGRSRRPVGGRQVQTAGAVPAGSDAFAEAEALAGAESPEQPWDEALLAVVEGEPAIPPVGSGGAYRWPGGDGVRAGCPPLRFCHFTLSQRSVSVWRAPWHRRSMTPWRGCSVDALRGGDPGVVTVESRVRRLLHEGETSRGVVPACRLVPPLYWGWAGLGSLSSRE